MTLIEFLLAAFLCSGMIAALWCFGPAEVARAIRVGLVALAGIVVWGIAWSHAPVLTRNATALFLGFLILAIVPKTWQNSRESARRTQCMDSLRTIGTKLHAAEEVRTSPPRDHAEGF